MMVLALLPFGGQRKAKRPKCPLLLASMAFCRSFERIAFDCRAEVMAPILRVVSFEMPIVASMAVA
jgi:hypothetical protein